MSCIFHFIPKTFVRLTLTYIVVYMIGAPLCAKADSERPRNQEPCKTASGCGFQGGDTPFEVGSCNRSSGGTITYEITNPHNGVCVRSTCTESSTASSSGCECDSEPCDPYDATYDAPNGSGS